MLLIENISGVNLDINDLGLTLAPNETIDLTIEGEPRDVAASGGVGGDLYSLISSNNIAVKDPLDNVTNLANTNAIDAIRAHNDTHYRMPVGARISDATDVSVTSINNNDIMVWDGTAWVPSDVIRISMGTCALMTVDDSGLDWCNYQVGSNGSAFTSSKKSLGTIQNPTAVTDGTKIGGWGFIGDDGVSTGQGSPGYVGAEISSWAVGDQTATNGGHNIQIVVTALGEKQRTTILQTDQDANIMFPEYTDTRDDGTTTKALYVDSTGTLQHGLVSADPASPVNSVQFNDNGVFGGDPEFTYDTTLKRLNVDGIDETTIMTLGGTSQVDSNGTDATLYVEVVAPGGNVEGLRTFFNRQNTGNNGWITYSYDGTAPYISLVDEDNDSPYINFDVIGTGSEASPQFRNRFRGREEGNATNGFQWEENGTRVATLENGTMNVLGSNAGYQINGTPIMRPTFCIFAEENSGIGVGPTNYEYSFGNGATNFNPIPSGIPMGVSCTLIAITASARNNTAGESTFSISVVNNGLVVATSGIASAIGTNSEGKVATQITPDTVNFSIGDTLQFLTASATGTWDDVRVVAWFERTS